MPEDLDQPVVRNLLGRWKAFSELQQRAFAFLAAEAVATGQEFEESANGAADVVCRLCHLDPDGIAEATRNDAFALVESLQAADRSRQGLEQVASVLDTLRGLHAALSRESAGGHPFPPTGPVMADWIDQLDSCVTLSDWRRRFHAALLGQDPGPRPRVHLPSNDEEILF